MGDFEIKIFLSLISLGLFGGLSHCGFMCGPFVLMQVNNNLAKIKIENVTYLQKLRGLALAPYHLGRITTYSFLGGICALIGKNARNFGNFHLISALILMIGSLLILALILKNLQIEIKFLQKLKPNFNFFKLKNFPNFIQNKLKILFKNPSGLKGYFLGVILGFIPCGLLYSALIISATLSNFTLGFLAMLIFGFFTIPSLFICAVGGYLFFNKLKFGFKAFSQLILLINMIVLFIMSLSQLKLI